MPLNLSGALVDVSVVDLRDRVAPGALRVNVSRRAHASDGLHLAGLGNPYRVGPRCQAGQASVYFRRYLWDVLDGDPTDGQRERDLLADLDRLERLVQAKQPVELGCWCGGRETCHAHVIHRAISWRLTQEV